MPKIMGVNIPNTYEGTCNSDMVASTTAIVSSELVNYGNDFFNNKYYMQVILNSNSAGNAPEREIRQITDYVSSTGTFTVSAFTANVEASDELLIIHESLIAPTADVATDTLLGHSIGIKTDAAVTTVGVVASIIAYVKGLLNQVAILVGYHAVPTADATTDTVMRDVVGRKTDAAVTTVGVVASIIAYVKGILNRIGTPAGASIAADIAAIQGAVVSTASATTTGVIVQDVASGNATLVTIQLTGTDTFSAWAVLDASASADSWICLFSLGFDSTATGLYGYVVEIGTGAAGSEATKIRVSFRANAGIAVGYVPLVFEIPIPIKVLSGVRIAARAASNQDATGKYLFMGLSMYQSLET